MKKVLISLGILTLIILVVIWFGVNIPNGQPAQAQAPRPKQYGHALDTGALVEIGKPDSPFTVEEAFEMGRDDGTLASAGNRLAAIYYAPAIKLLCWEYYERSLGFEYAELSMGNGVMMLYRKDGIVEVHPKGTLHTWEGTPWGCKASNETVKLKEPQQQ